MQPSFKDTPFMALSSSQPERQRLAGTLDPGMKCGAEAALTTAHRFWLRVTSCCACRVWMRTNHRARHIMDGPIQLALVVGLLLQGCQKPLPDPGFLPAIATTCNTRPLAILFWHVTPRRARAVNPHPPVDQGPMVIIRMSSVCFLRR